MVRHSIPAGEVVLVNLPPYSTQPWLSTGIVFLAGLLRREGVAARVVRAIATVGDVPPAVVEASFVTFLRDPTMEQRLDAMERASAEAPAFFEGMLAALLAGPERVFAFSVFRNNVDVSLLVARLLKRRRPGCTVIFGGPEAIEEPAALRLPWVDVVVGRNAEQVWLPLVRALLEGRPERAPQHPSLWLGPALDAGPRPRLPTALSAPPPPLIDYASLMPLLLGDTNPTIPVWLNLGCPYHCGFCSNQNIYGRFVRGDSDLVMEQLEEIVAAWHRLGADSDLNIQFSDPTTNVLPQQLDALLGRVAEAQRRWPTRPMLRGQTLFDQRVTEENVRVWVEANFTSVFFGLDSANDDQRRLLGKPGTRAHVEEAMRAFQRGGGRHLFFGLPVGMPGETRALFEENVGFIEWALGLGGVVEGVTILPYVFFLQGQDPTWSARNTGERRGLLWRMDAPGGDPAERAGRCMELFDRIGARTQATTPFPPALAWPMMLPDESPAALDAWFERHGRAHDQPDGGGGSRPVDPGQSARGRKEATPLLDEAEARSFALAWERGLAESPWKVEACECRVVSHTPSVIVLLTEAATARRVAVALQAHAEGRGAFARTPRFLISYLTSWRGGGCVFDAGVMARGLEIIRRWEAASARATSGDPGGALSDSRRRGP